MSAKQSKAMACSDKINLNHIFEGEHAEALGEPTHFPCPHQASIAAAPIYSTGSAATDTEAKAAQLRHLALIGIAAMDSSMNLKHLDDAFQGLFEVMHRMAGEVEQEVEEMKRLARKEAA